MKKPSSLKNLLNFLLFLLAILGFFFALTSPSYAAFTCSGAVTPSSAEVLPGGEQYFYIDPNKVINPDVAGMNYKYYWKNDSPSSYSMYFYYTGGCASDCLDTTFHAPNRAELLLPHTFHQGVEIYDPVSGTSCTDWATVTIIPFPDLVCGDISPSSATLVPGETKTFSSSSSGGSGSYQYAWEIIAPDNSTNAIGPTQINSWQAPEDVVGNKIYQIKLSVSDTEAGSSCTTTASVMVKGYEELSCEITPEETTVNVGEKTTFSLIPSGGSGDFEYSWSQEKVGGSGYGYFQGPVASTKAVLMVPKLSAGIAKEEYKVVGLVKDDKTSSECSRTARLFVATSERIESPSEEKPSKSADDDLITEEKESEAPSEGEIGEGRSYRTLIISGLAALVGIVALIYYLIRKKKLFGDKSLTQLDEGTNESNPQIKD